MLLAKKFNTINWRDTTHFDSEGDYRTGCPNVSRELKHQTFLIHERRGWPRRSGSGTRFACQMQIIKQNNVKTSRTPTEYFSWKCLSKFCVEFCFFVTKKTWFQMKNFYFCITNTLRKTQNLNLWFQPENSRFEVRDRSSRTSWHAQWLSCCNNTSGWRPWYQERLVLKFPSHCQQQQSYSGHQGTNVVRLTL